MRRRSSDGKAENDQPIELPEKEGAITTLDVAGVLIDLDGTVYQGSELIAGAAAAIERLRDARVPLLFTTNTSRKSRRDIIDSLRSMGLEIGPDEVFSAPVAAAEWLADQGVQRVQLLLPASTHDDFTGFEITAADPEVVLVGDLGAEFTFERLNAAFRSLRGGAGLVAVHRNRFWLPEAGPTLDAGAFVAALEYAARVEATLVGKPSAAFFRTAASRTGVALERLAVVGDDAESDVAGARAAGLMSIQVRTGKFARGRQASLLPGELPDRVIGSIADLPELLGA
ncbi:MAG: TIGR01458 family HAD-type hydrolase [Gemmatimonadota bacterium]